MVKKTSVLVFLVFLLVGCGASRVEVIDVVQHIPTFKEIIQIMDVSGPCGTWAVVDTAYPELQKKDSNNAEMLCEHIVVFRTISGGVRIVTLSNSRPPEIMGLSQEFK